MFKPTRTALCIALGALALAASEANAGCKIISGSYVCASWIKGSEICQVTVDSSFGDPGSGVEVTCTVMGGYFDSEGPSACITGELPEGTLICESSTPAPDFYRTSSRSSSNSKSTSASSGNGKGQAKHDCKHAAMNVGHVDPECFVSDDDFVPDVPSLDGQMSKTVTAKCNGNGICTASAEILDPDLADACPAETPSLVDFTATAFLGKVEACLDGGEGPCEALWQWCELNGNEYDCQEIPEPNECYD